MSEHPCTNQIADYHTCYAIDVAHGNRRSEESVICPCYGHHDVAHEEIGLRDGKVMLLVFLGIHEVEHCRRPLHTEESSHQSAQCSCCNLHRQRCLYLDALAEEGEVDAHNDQCNA